jgi:hypothetical protein
MIASACLAGQLPPSAFGVVDPVDVQVVAAEILDLLHEESDRQRIEQAKRKLEAL